ncbi:hypothetical protein BS78_05G274400 [Paspalum vaginatum]|nr:hypothetical protein BS78_05G274400 [Paspalum vaginatum]
MTAATPALEAQHSPRPHQCPPPCVVPTARLRAAAVWVTSQQGGAGAAAAWWAAGAKGRIARCYLTLQTALLCSHLNCSHSSPTAHLELQLVGKHRPSRISAYSSSRHRGGSGTRRRAGRRRRRRPWTPPAEEHQDLTRAFAGTLACLFYMMCKTSISENELCNIYVNPCANGFLSYRTWSVRTESKNRVRACRDVLSISS